jgi:hypothetical protein
MVVNLDTHIKHIHQVLYESINYSKQILIWDRVSIIYNSLASLINFLGYYSSVLVWNFGYSSINFNTHILR